MITASDKQSEMNAVIRQIMSTCHSLHSLCRRLWRHLARLGFFSCCLKNQVMPCRINKDKCEQLRLIFPKNL